MIDTKELRRLAQAVPLPQTDYVLGLEGDGYTSDHLLTEPGYSEEQMRDYVSQTILVVLDRLEAAEKERDALRAAVRHEADCVEAAKAEIKALRAKIEAMEKQEPECEVVGQVRNVLYEVRTLKYDLPAGTKLYALPGAQPELNLSDPAVQKRLATQWGYVQKPHPDCDFGCMFQCAKGE